MRKIPLWIWPVLTVLLALALRVYDLSADPPNHMAKMGKMGQDLLTDPYHITSYARDKALFGEWDFYHYDRWVVFRVSLVSALSWLIFMIAGVGRWTANLTAVILNVGACALIVAAVARAGGGLAKRGALLSACAVGGLLAVSQALIVFGRLPYLENGLLFLSALTMYIAVTARDIWWRWALAGAVAVLAALSGKIFGALIIAPVLALALSAGGRRFVYARFVLVGAAFCAGLWYALALGTSAGAFHTYLGEQSYALYGFPLGLSSPQGFIQQLVLYGADNGITRLHLFLPVALLAGIVGLNLMERGKQFSQWNRAALFLAVWALVAWLGLMPHNYRPLRYGLFVLAPALGLLGYTIGALFSDSARAKRKVGWTTYVVVFLGCWITVEHCRFYMFGSGMTPIAWGSLLYAVPISGAICALLYWRKQLAPASLRYALVALCLIECGYQVQWYIKLTSNITHDLAAASRDIGELVGPNAVFSAPYGPQFVIDTDRKNVIYTFGLAHEDKDLFQRFPITHLAIDEINWEMAAKKFPEIANAHFQWNFVLRDVSVRLMRLSDSVGGADNYTPTDFERSQEFAGKDMADSAIYYGARFYNEHPTNRVAAKHVIRMYLFGQEIEKAFAVGQKLITDHPSDFDSWMLLGRVYYNVGTVSRRTDLIALAQAYTEKAVALNPAIEAHIRERVKRAL